METPSARNIIIGIIVTLSLSHVLTVQACPVTCDCHMTNQTSHVTCINQSLTSIPDDIPKNVTHLDLRGNRISSLTKVFQQFTQVQTLDLSFNNLTSISESDFNSSFNLIELDISSNVISTIEQNSFANIPKLEVLNLANNSIYSLSGAIFFGLLNLKKLYIQQNELSVLTMDTFIHIEALTILDLSSNSIREIPSDIFTNLQNLSVLNVHDNLISKLNGTDSFPGGNSLQYLDLSFNDLAHCSNFTFPALKFLNLSWNKLESIAAGLFENTENITSLILDGNPLVSLTTEVFSSFKYLNTLSMSNMPNLTYLSKATFEGLENLELLLLHNNPNLSFIHKQLFTPLHGIRTIDLSYNSIFTLLNGTFTGSNTELSSLGLQGNEFICDCNLEWLIEDIQTNNSIIEQPQDLQCNIPSSNVTATLFTFNVDLLHCSDVQILNYTTDSKVKIGRSAILKCNAVSDPSPQIIWITPRDRVLNYHDFHQLAIKDYLPLHDQDAHKVYHSSHKWHEQPSYYSESESRHDRIIILEDGSLYIDYVMRSDGGPYKCIAKNPRNSTEVTINLYLDYNVISHTEVWGFVVGFACAGSFFLLNLIYSLSSAAVRRCVSQRRRERIRQMIETMDHYKTAQLTRIKENYNNQVGRIRDQYHYQLGRIREHHQNQMSRMGRMREGASQKVDKLKENYNNQLGRLKDYSSSQLVQIREKYNSQVDKIKDYGSDKLERIHEKYKLKQQHVIKLLDMMNLDKCRTVFESECVRTESMILHSDVFNSEAPLHSPIDSVSVSDSEYMTATSTESSKYSSQHNISRNIDDDNDDDLDDPISPLNPYIPEPDNDINDDSLSNANIEETSFINEALGLSTSSTEITDQQEIRMSSVGKQSKQKRKLSHKQRRRYDKSEINSTEETEKLNTNICDEDIKNTSKDRKRVSDNIEAWKILDEPVLSYIKAASDTHIPGLSANTLEQEEVSPPGSISSGRSSLSSKDRPLSLVIGRCVGDRVKAPKVPQPGARRANQDKDQVIIDMDNGNLIPGWTIRESDV